MKSPTRKHVFIIEDASEAANVRDLLGQHSYEVSPLESALESADGDAVYQIRHAIPAAKMRDVQSGHTEPEPRIRADLKGNYEGIVGESPLVFEMLKYVEDVASTNATVLILGETGTGKEGIARAVHLNGKTPKKVLVTADCASIVDTLAESELFGHEKGAYTGAEKVKPGLFEMAEGGTLFFDEIGELPLSIQAKLLRVLQEREFRHLGGTEQIHVNVRIVAATNRYLPDEVDAGRFRLDLYQRLSNFTIVVPPLRERREDIRMLAEHFLTVESEFEGFPRGTLSPAVCALFQTYDWPGNIRELQQTMMHAVVRSKGGVILPKHLPKQFEGSEAPQMDFPKGALRREAAHTVKVPLQIPLSEALKAAEKACIEDALTRCNQNRARAAEMLGMKERTFYNKLKHHGIPRRAPFVNEV